MAAAALATSVSLIERGQACRAEPEDLPSAARVEAEQRNRADAAAVWNDLEYASAVRLVRSSYKLSLSSMQELAQFFISEARAGLSGQPSSLAMLPTFVTTRVTGAEVGTFYALDLGGTNFRILRLTLEGEGVVGPVKQKKFDIPDEVKNGSGEGLFGFLADSVATFIATECGGDPEGTLGFTFSFPIEQTGLASGSLVTWNKGFSAEGVVGKDVVAMLQEQFERRGIHLVVKALANDTVGTMEAAAYSYPDTVMGVIFGTGTNAAYIEKTARMGKWRGAASEEMVVNCEWGNLDMSSLMNSFDQRLDSASSNPGCQTYEKMISGFHLGELCRITMLDERVAQALSPACARNLREVFADQGSFKTALMSACESDSTEDLCKVAAALSEAGVSATARDRTLVREVCMCISTRAARLSATGVSALLDCAHVESAATVAVDGTVFEKYPRFQERIEAGIGELRGPQAPAVNLVLAKDGSGVGAAIIAATA